jgi:hypothetical protein
MKGIDNTGAACVSSCSWMGGWMGGWMDGWVGGSKSCSKDCLQQSKTMLLRESQLSEVGQQKFEQI